MKRAGILIACALMILAAIITACEEKPSGKASIELTGDWEFRRAGEGVWHAADVPGCVHTDLLGNGLIDDPFYRSNEEALQWIEETGWEYRVSFSVGKEMAQRENVELCFAGLDTYADVYLNDSLVLSANNMFREWRIDCGWLIHEGENSLLLYFHSPVKVEKRIQKTSGIELPGGPKVFTRKAGYHYGWDWGPRFVTTGIWRRVHLTAWDGVRIVSLHLIQDDVSDESAEFTAVFEIESTGKRGAIDSKGERRTPDSTGERHASISILSQDGMMRLSSRDVRLRKGINVVELAFAIPDPKLWWTNGLGTQHLYELIGEVRVGGAMVDRVRERIGIRTLALVTEKDTEGETFYFTLNGVPVFMKGANYIPQDSFIPRVTRERYESVMQSAVDAGMNMLRVWGGGVYESDLFYDLCDERGILVWQDFMFACAMYPGDEAFLDNVRREAIDNVRRLRNHPCIALWCGNNEVDEAWHNWGWQTGYSKQERAEIWKNYEALFHELLPEIVEEHDYGRPYWPSSPKYGRADPLSLREGDAHYWGVWHDEEPFEVLEAKVPRFMSEFGFQSFPRLETIESFTAAQDRDLESEAMRAHQKHPRGNRLIKTYMERYYRIPEDFESFLYVSQLLQAIGVRTGIEAHRRNRPYCMGTLYWQLNDCWPVASWSSIDYFGNWKALHYHVKKAYSDVLVSPVMTGDTIDVFVVSDLPRPVAGSLRLELVDFSGNVLLQRTISARIPPGSSERWFRAESGGFLQGMDRTRIVLSAELWSGGELLSRNLLYFATPKGLDLPEAVIKKTIARAGQRYRIELSSDVLAKNCFLTLKGGNGYFTDNYFDILPGDTVEIELVTDATPDGIGERISVKSLADIY